MEGASDGVNLPNDFEESQVLWGELSAGQAESEVVTVRIALLPADSAVDLVMGGLPDLFCLPEPVVVRGDLGLVRIPVTQRRFKAQNPLERCEPGG